MPISLLFSEPTTFLVWILAVVYAITIHEFAHALAGHLQGDRTAEDAGRLTLNPLSHIDFLGFALLVLVGFGWGKPTPFNPYALKNHRFGPAIVGLAGPLSNLISVIVFAVILRLIIFYSGLGQGNLFVEFIVSLIQVNLVLMIFNLIPIPPLDGSKVLYSFLPYSKNHIIFFLERYGAILLLALILLASPLLALVFNFFYKLILAAVFA